MKIKWPIFIIVSLFMVASCSRAENSGLKKVVITTDYGDITIELFDETPLHRDNFIKLAKEGFFDGLLFHRVINHFMIQGGDPASRGAEPGARLGSGGPGYQIPAEINPKFYHKKGMLAAARQPDQANPERQSSGSQFYIVQGEIYRPGQLDTLEIKMNYNLQQSFLRKYFTEAQEELNAFRQANDEAGFNIRVAEIRAKADSAFQISEKYSIPEGHRKDYTTIGGYPSLDGAYTIFGQVVEGMDVLDKIAAVQTDQANRPLKDIIMKVKVIE